MVSARLANDDCHGQSLYYGHVVHQPLSSILHTEDEQAHGNFQYSLLTQISHDCGVWVYTGSEPLGSLWAAK